MPEKVIKNDGRKEDFIREKIVVNVVKTGAPADIGRAIADKVINVTEEESMGELSWKEH
ncbi:MAG: hypothetical protein JSV09_15185 [Thermoplasmata archaeon]|nr:MAG: hypothetical protein JSV09_15185 [Thermoplasmata archaeon]